MSCNVYYSRTVTITVRSMAILNQDIYIFYKCIGLILKHVSSFEIDNMIFLCDTQIYRMIKI